MQPSSFCLNFEFKSGRQIEARLALSAAVGFHAAKLHKQVRKFPLLRAAYLIGLATGAHE
jgi:hypothetical protein